MYFVVIITQCVVDDGVLFSLLSVMLGKTVRVGVLSVTTRSEMSNRELWSAVLPLLCMCGTVAVRPPVGRSVAHNPLLKPVTPARPRLSRLSLLLLR